MARVLFIWPGHIYISEWRVRRNEVHTKSIIRVIRVMLFLLICISFTRRLHNVRYALLKLQVAFGNVKLAALHITQLFSLQKSTN